MTVQRLLAICLAALASSAAVADSPPEWTRPHKPFRVVGPVYYVGTEGIAAYLIRTSAGLILLDTGPEEAVPIVERNIAALGFDLHDVKTMIVTHAHWDHAAGLSALKRDTGARLLASAADRRALETGIPPSDTNYGVKKFAPVKVDGIVADGRAVQLGDVKMTPVLTPGHTPGCTSWTVRVKEGPRPLQVMFPCSLTVAGNKLSGNKGYPGIVSDFRYSFDRLRKEHADVLLPSHPEFADVLGRARRRDAGENTAFVAPRLLPQLLNNSQKAFEEELRKQDSSR